MEFKDYQNKIYRAIPDHESQKDEILHWAIGLSEECGEVMSVLKHHYYGGEDFNREELIKEIGDVLWYTAALCTAAGVNMDSIAKCASTNSTLTTRGISCLLIPHIAAMGWM